MLYLLALIPKIVKILSRIEFITVAPPCLPDAFSIIFEQMASSFERLDPQESSSDRSMPTHGFVLHPRA
jgi:hypothetical protein